jgi:glycine/D-amino acid oxidase-like deaminating enzyme
MSGRRPAMRVIVLGAGVIGTSTQRTYAPVADVTL